MVVAATAGGGQRCCAGGDPGSAQLMSGEPRFGDDGAPREKGGDQAGPATESPSPSGLDTLTPNLIVGDGVKMIGEYEGTVGTYYLFSESDASPNPVHDHTEPPKVNQDKLGNTNKEGPSKEVKHLASVQKILKFRSINEDHQEHRAYQHKDKEFSFDPSNRM
ncbi:hypothetical protein D1007_41592 [Hordeum vulgare]|nr:hypothetical protein D1007_41592 [Hordeum vulgare]